MVGATSSERFLYLHTPFSDRLCKLFLNAVVDGAKINEFDGKSRGYQILATISVNEYLLAP